LSDYTDEKRLSDIVKSLVYCEQGVTPESVRNQFYRETHREPDEIQLARVTKTRRPDQKDELDFFA
jgi:hypothetical protein